MSAVEDQLHAINLRIDRLEKALLGLHARRSGSPYSVAPSGLAPQSASLMDEDFQDTSPQNISMAPRVPPTAPARARVPNTPKPAADVSEITVTQVMGWTGATLLVLAMAYLIRLVYDVGWLTPNRQLVLALLSGVALIVAGLKLRQIDNSYASLLPAGGLVILFLVIYGAHLYYQVIGTGAATAAVICNCLLAMWLGRIFASEIYGLFAAVGSYSAPLLLASLSGSVFDLAIYFTGWSVVFSLYALAIERRRPYLLAAFMALLVFHLVWGDKHAAQWQTAVAFQTLQFVIFLAAAIAFSIRHQSPLTQADGVVHLPLLLVFYGLQYSVLHQYVPTIAPWISIASACVLLLAYGVARLALPQALTAGAFIVSAYCALVFFHAVYLELLPEAWAPWTVLLLLPLLSWLAGRTKADGSTMLPWKLLAGGLFAINFLRVLFAFDHTPSEHNTLLTFLYSLELYVGYFLARQTKVLSDWLSFVLYAAHIGLMTVALQLFDTPVVVSLTWSALAISALWLAFSLNDKTLGQSSLLVFVAALVKLLLLDLSGAQPLLRIGSLLVVGIAMYVGGLLYKRIAALGG